MIHPPLGLTLTRTATATGHRCGSGGSATDRGTATHIPAPKCRAWPAAQHQLLQSLGTKAPLGCLASSLVVAFGLISGTQRALLRTRQSGCSSCCRQATMGLGVPKQGAADGRRDGWRSWCQGRGLLHHADPQVFQSRQSFPLSPPLNSLVSSRQSAFWYKDVRLCFSPCMKNC